MNFVLLTICAIVVQFTTERIKVIISETHRSNLTPLVALVVGLLLSFATRVGFFTVFGINLDPVWIDYIFTGIAYSGGAVVFNELIKLISEARQGAK